MRAIHIVSSLTWPFAVQERNLDFLQVMMVLMMGLMRPDLHRGRHGLPHDQTSPKRMASHWDNSPIDYRLSSPGSVRTGGRPPRGRQPGRAGRRPLALLGRTVSPRGGR